MIRNTSLLVLVVITGTWLSVTLSIILSSEIVKSGFKLQNSGSRIVT